jgi:hypothetical protein
MNRKQWILAGLLGVQVLLLLVARSPMAGATAPAEAQALFPRLDSFTPERVEIQGSADDIVTLSRGGDGWAIDEAGGYPAQADKVEQLVDKLKEVQVRRPVVSSSRYHRALKVAEGEHERRVKIWQDDAGSPELDFFLGSSPNYQRIHVRRAGDDEVYEIQGLGSYDVRPEPQAWFDTSFVSVEPARVTSLRLENSRGAFEIEKGADGAWSVVSPGSEQGRTLSAAKVDALVRTAASLRVVEPAGRRDDTIHGLASPQATVLLRYTRAGGELAPEESHEVSVLVGGAPADDETRLYVARSGFGYVAEAYKTSVDKLLEQELAGLEEEVAPAGT